ncbi:uncharacterized protein LOC114349393 [Diabrotica virgifera virgifera]|uniref:UPAR/Ly6 domain-containing protein qvr n=1 Tax=Diabrotica virgifera virgifera TaxID=50390 RepID=A0ABM5J0C1_DIAVI|nr:uncharacterized protein LOC114349393 [Diabrotica virgifera virgifera]
MANLLGTIILFGFFALGFATQELISCYDCKPSADKPDECVYPEKNLAPVSNCQPPSNGTAVCVSSYVQNINAARTGVYRGCFNITAEIGNACDLFVEELSSNTSTIKFCRSCTTDRCNTDYLNEKGAANYNYNLESLIIINILAILVASIWK